MPYLWRLHGELLLKHISRHEYYEAGKECTATRHYWTEKSLEKIENKR